MKGQSSKNHRWGGCSCIDCGLQRKKVWYGGTFPKVFYRRGENDDWVCGNYTPKCYDAFEKDLHDYLRSELG